MTRDKAKKELDECLNEGRNTYSLIDKIYYDFEEEKQDLIDKYIELSNKYIDLADKYTELKLKGK